LRQTNYRRQKAARSVLDALFESAENTLVIHYSCESFYDRQTSTSPRITSIAVRRLHSGQTDSFSIHQVAERNGRDPQDIESIYDQLEKQMLKEFFEFVDHHQTQRWLHWNMRDINYGFPALEHRCRVLGNEPVPIHDSQKVDLARLLVDIYGIGYIGHPRLEKLVEKNEISRLHFMSGAEEAGAFIQHNYVGLHQSTLRKVDIIANIAGRAHDGTLKTNASWWDIHGGSVKGAADWLTANPVWGVVIGLLTIVGAVLTTVALLKGH
jgi:hypothetical protein